MSNDAVITKFEVIEVKFRELIGEMKCTWKEYKKMSKEVKTDVSSRKRPASKISTEWACEGRLWENKPCHGCKKCNTEQVVVYDRSKRKICKSCASDYVKWKRLQKKLKTENKE